MVKIVIVPVCEIANACFHGARFDKLRHHLPGIVGLDLDDGVRLNRFFEKRDDHRLPFTPTDVSQGPRPTFFEYASHC